MASERTTAAALTIALAALAVGGGLLYAEEQALRRAEALGTMLEATVAAEEDRSFEVWLGPWMEAWLEENRPGAPVNRAALSGVSSTFLVRYGGLSTHENVVKHGLITNQQRWVRGELRRLLGPRDADAYLTDLQNAWGRHFQGLAVTEPGGGR